MDWKDGRPSCRALTGPLPVSALAEKFDLDVSREERQQLLVKYDLRDSGRFAYCDFLQRCVLLLRAPETSLLRRMRIQNAHKMVRAGNGWGRAQGCPASERRP